MFWYCAVSMKDGILSSTTDLATAQGSLAFGDSDNLQAIIPMSGTKAGDPLDLETTWLTGSMWWRDLSDLKKMQAVCENANQTKAFAAWEQAFSQLDTNDDKTILKSELEAAARLCGHTSPDAIAKFVATMLEDDTDNSGSISLKEFMAAMPKIEKEIASAAATPTERKYISPEDLVASDLDGLNIKGIYGILDPDFSGTIDPDELKALYTCGVLPDGMRKPLMRLRKKPSVSVKMFKDAFFTAISGNIEDDDSFFPLTEETWKEMTDSKDLLKYCRDYIKAVEGGQRITLDGTVGSAALLEDLETFLNEHPEYQ